MPGGAGALTPAPESPSGFRGLAPRRKELGELVRLAVPVVVVQVGMMLMGVVDTVMVGRVSPTHLAAVALGHLYFFTFTVFGLGTLLALDPVVAQAVGAGDSEGVARGVQRGVLLALALAVLATLLMLPARPFMLGLGQPVEVVPVAAAYVTAAMPGVFPFYAFVVFRQTLQAMGHVRPIVVVVVVANVANAACNWVLVFGNLGAPALGAAGAGVASSLSRWLMAIGLLMLAWNVLRPVVHPPRPGVSSAAPLLGLARLGSPIGMQLLLEFGAFGIIGILMGWLGTTAMAGHQIAINLASLTFMVPLGIGQATAVLVGRAVGEEDPERARRSAGAGLLAGGGFMVLTAVVFLLFPQGLARMYSGDATVVALAASLLPVAGVFQVFDGLQVVASAVLRGIGDTRAPMVMSVLGFWLVGLPVSLAVGFRLEWGAVGLWWGLCTGLAVVAGLLLLRVRHRFGRELRRLEAGA